MTRLRISLALLVLVFACVGTALAQVPPVDPAVEPSPFDPPAAVEPTPTKPAPVEPAPTDPVPPAPADPAPDAQPAVEVVDQARADEVKQTALDVMKYTDADGDGTLMHPETTNARMRVIEIMQDTLPSASYIAGGQRTIARMRFGMEQTVIDENRDGEIDKYELEIYVARMIVMRETAVRTHRSHQFRAMMDDAMMDPVWIYNSKGQREHQHNMQYWWQAQAVQQRRANWFEIQGRKRVMRTESERSIAEVAREAERDRLRRQALEDAGNPSTPNLPETEPMPQQ